MRKAKFAILGAGIAGLGAALGLRERGEESIIFEKNSTSGGLLDSLIINGFIFDKAVHLSFATEPKVREIFDETPFITHPSDSYCFDEGRWLKHPIQNNLSKLEPDEKVRLIESYVARPDELPIENYRDWLYHQYGFEISEKYPIRYTRKYWCSEPQDLSITWVGNRMRRSRLSEILYGAFSEQTPNHYYTKEMRYPVSGGYKSFIDPLIKNSIIENNANIVEIDTVKKILYFESLDPVAYDHLISTLPLPTLVNSIKGAPEDVIFSSQKLKVTSMDLVSVGFNKKIIDHLWFYIYDEDIFASRAYSPSVKSPNNCPPGCSSIQFEIYSLGDVGIRTKEDLMQNTIYALHKLGIAKPEDILFMEVHHISHANVLFYNGMENDRDNVLNYLKSQEIKSCGRFGEWDYLWSNQSLLSGYRAAIEL
ncbi:NAD(P)/FAD-dependent oxidoreductase [Polynucleobacter sp. UK-Kesae-W10]|uniref:protoporphyrinogen/coproporphyrinogen oxidase n=1 Tax=Polynucleobacter sp. UK-Kesae-W10 TaxID=1819738 RepID=UPI001C0E675D|nr:NAD(P)-binding protein [Polynucleobacter sp. UK-Kesae-W10]